MVHNTTLLIIICEVKAEHTTRTQERDEHCRRYFERGKQIESLKHGRCSGDELILVVVEDIPVPTLSHRALSEHDQSSRIKPDTSSESLLKYLKVTELLHFRLAQFVEHQSFTVVLQLSMLLLCQCALAVDVAILGLIIVLCGHHQVRR